MDDSSDLFSAMPQQPKPADAAPRKPAAPVAGNEAPRPAPKTSDGSDYDASAIEVLEGLERSHEGLGTGVSEVVALLEQPDPGPWRVNLGMASHFLTVRRAWARLVGLAT